MWFGPWSPNSPNGHQAEKLYPNYVQLLDALRVAVSPLPVCRYLLCKVQGNSREAGADDEGQFPVQQPQAAPDQRNDHRRNVIDREADGGALRQISGIGRFLKVGVQPDGKVEEDAE